MSKQTTREADTSTQRREDYSSLDALWRKLAGPCPTNPKHAAIRVWGYDPVNKVLACVCDSCGAEWRRPQSDVAENFSRVRYQAMPCPADQKHGEMRVYTVKPLVRYLRCETCGTTAKAPGTAFDADLLPRLPS